MGEPVLTAQSTDGHRTAERKMRHKPYAPVFSALARAADAWPVVSVMTGEKQSHMNSLCP